MTTKSAINDYINDIKDGMSDCDAIRAICKRYVADRAACGYKSDFYRIENKDGAPCYANGKEITDEPPLGVLSNLNAAHNVTATLRRNLVARWTFIDWKEVDADDLARCVIFVGPVFCDDRIPSEFVEDPEEDDPAAVLAAAKKRLVEGVLFAIDDANNESDDELIYSDPCDIVGDYYPYVLDVAKRVACHDWSNYYYGWRAWNEKGKATDGDDYSEIERSTVIRLGGDFYADLGDELVAQHGVEPTDVDRALNRYWVLVTELTTSEIEEYGNMRVWDLED